MILNIIKDGRGNIIISEGSFGTILSALNKENIREELKEILNQKYLFNTTDDGYYLSKKYEHQEGFIEWTGDDVALVYKLFKDTVLNYELPTNLIPLDGTECIKGDSEPIGKTEDGWIVCKPEPSPWLIERPIRYDGEYLSISENGKKNRPWKVEEIKEIEKLFNKE